VACHLRDHGSDYAPADAEDTIRNPSKDWEAMANLVTVKKVRLHRTNTVFWPKIEAIKSLGPHPGICRLLDVYIQERERSMVFVTEPCHGPPLFERILVTGTLAEAAVASIVHQVASALQHVIHERNVSHSDLCPENICFCSSKLSNMQVKITNWGLGVYKSLLAFLRSMDVSAIGGLDCSAPDTASGDMWSLGVLMYALLTGMTVSCRRGMTSLPDLQHLKRVSPSAGDLIGRLLTSSSRERLRVDQVLMHDWFRISHALPVSQQRQRIQYALISLRQMFNTQQFISVCLSSVFKPLNDLNVRRLMSIFYQLDQDRSGCIPLQIFKEGLERFFVQLGKETDLQEGLELGKVTQMFNWLDLDGSHAISYRTFCKVARKEKQLAQDDALWSIFEPFGRSNDRGPTKEELRIAFTSEGLSAMWDSDVLDHILRASKAEEADESPAKLQFEQFSRKLQEAAWPTPTSNMLDPSALPDEGGFADQANLTSPPNFVSWLSLDPRTSDLVSYYGGLALRMEAAWQAGLQVLTLEAGRKVVFCKADRGHYQRTQKGLRDVRRVELPRSGGPITLPVHWSGEQWRVADSDEDTREVPSPTLKESSINVSPDDMVDVKAAMEIARRTFQTDAVDSLRWNADADLEPMLSTTPRKDAAKITCSEQKSSWWPFPEEWASGSPWLPQLFCTSESSRQSPTGQMVVERMDSRTQSRSQELI